MNRYLPMLSALGCGLLLPFSFAPFDALPLAILGLGGWLYVLQRYPEQAFKLGLAFGFGWFGLGAWWLADTLQTYGHLPYILGLLAIAVLGLVVGVFMAGWAWLLVWLQGKPKDVLWLFPLLGVLEEWLRSFVFSGLPWTALGNLVLSTPASAWVSVLGSYGVTWFLLLLVSALVLLLQHESRKPAAVALLGCVIWLFAAPTVAVPKYPSQQVALIQPNIAQDHKWDAAFLQTSMARLVQLSAQASDADLIIWPETSVPMILSQAPAWDAWLHQQMQSWHTAVLFGGIKVVVDTKSGVKSLQNGLFLAESDASAAPERQFVGKHHLVPFGEYVPAWLPWLNQLIPEIGDFQPAVDAGVLSLDMQTIGVLICYESIFADEARARIAQGAAVLVVVSNDAWYDQSPAAWQHLQAAQMRALETGRYVLRATNTGISAVIAPDGSVQQTMPWWQAGVVRGNYEPLTHLTLYQQWGDTPILFLLLFGLLWAAYGKYRRRA